MFFEPAHSLLGKGNKYAKLIYCGVYNHKNIGNNPNAPHEGGVNTV
jgi:hypothetical protein